MKINIHRYYNKVALSIAGQPTQYLEQELAAQLASVLNEAVVDIEHREFTKSRFESRELEVTQGALDKLPKGGCPVLSEVLADVRGAVVPSDIAFKTIWRHDPAFVWDGDGPDPKDTDFMPYTVEVRALKIHNGVLLTGSAFLGGFYSKDGGKSDPEIGGYLEQLKAEALVNLNSNL